MKYLKLKIEDAVNATKAAIAEGVVAGGGVAFIKVSKKLSEKALSLGLTEDALIGYSIVSRALEAPLKQIATNAGKDNGSVIVENVKNGRGNAGYDALKDIMVPDMLAVGIIDPVKVTRTALENAASAAAILLTTEAAIADEPEKKEKNNAPGSGR